MSAQGLTVPLTEEGLAAFCGTMVAHLISQSEGLGCVIRVPHSFERGVLSLELEDGRTVLISVAIVAKPAPKPEVPDVESLR